MLLSATMNLIYLLLLYYVCAMPTAFVLIKCEEGEEHKITRDIDEAKVKLQVEPTIGHYDLVARVTSAELDDVNEIIDRLHKNDKIQSMKILVTNSDTTMA